MQLSFSAVHHQEIGKRTLFAEQTGEVSFDHLVHHCEVVLPFDGFDPETPIRRLVGASLPEADQTRDREGCSQIGNVETDNHMRHIRQPQRLLQIRHRLHPRLIRQLGVFERARPDQRLQISQNVAEGGRLFKRFFRGGFCHFLPELLGDLADLAVQHRDHAVDPLPVLLLRHAVHAGPAAVADRPGQTVPELLLSGRFRLAGAQSKPPGQILGQTAHGAPVRERTEIKTRILLPDPGQTHARKPFVPINFQHRIAFVVPEQDIVVRRVLLDEAGLQNQRLVLAFHRKDLPPVDRMDQGAQLRIRPPGLRRLKIVRHAPPQIRRLPHINHRSEPVAIHINPRLGRNIPGTEIRTRHQSPAFFCFSARRRSQ